MVESRGGTHLFLASSAPILVSTLILLYGASFTLTLTVVQAFCTAGLESVKDGLSALQQSRYAVTAPTVYQPVVSGLYAGGFAALTVLRNEAAAAFAVGVDMGKRIGSLLESLLLPREEGGASIDPEEMEPIGEAGSPTAGTAKLPPAASSGFRRRWAAALLLGASVSAFVSLALLFVRPTRIASLCVLAAQSLVAHVVPFLRENTRARVEGTRAGRGVLIAAAAGLGMAVQAALYLADSNAWYLPNGSAIPAPLRLLLSAPLALENALEEVRLACKCDLGRLQGLAGVSIDATFMSVLANRTWAAPA